MQGADCAFLPQSEAQRGRIRRSRGLENPLHLLGRGDPQQDAIFSALLAQAFDDREDSVFEPELCAEDGVEVRDYVITGLDRGTALNDRSALLHPAHAIADTHFDAGLLRRRFALPLWRAWSRPGRHRPVRSTPAWTPHSQTEGTSSAR